MMATLNRGFADACHASRPIQAFVMAVLYASVPLTALTLLLLQAAEADHRGRSRVVAAEVDPAYRQAYEPDKLSSYGWAVAYLSASRSSD